MIGAYASVTVDVGDVEKGLDATKRRVHALGPAFAQVKEPMRDDQKEHRKDKAGPESKWAPRAASTIASYRHRKHARALLGKLPTAVAYKASATGVTAESRAAWSDAHQEGAIVGHGARLPQRTFLWISDKLIDVATDIISAALLAAWGGR